MKFTLENTDIFDFKLSNRVKQYIVAANEKPNAEYWHKLNIIFPVKLIHDYRINTYQFPDDIELPEYKKKQNSWEDRLDNLLSQQIDEVIKVLSQNGIEISDASIIGRNKIKASSIRIEILADNKIQYKKGKKVSNIKAVSIISDEEAVKNNVTKVASQQINKIYSDFRDVIVSPILFSKILNIEPTKDEEKLWKTFVKQYGDLWLCTEERKNKLLNKLEKRLKLIAAEYEMDSVKSKKEGEK